MERIAPMNDTRNIAGCPRVYDREKRRQYVTLISEIEEKINAWPELLVDHFKELYSKNTDVTDELSKIVGTLEKLRSISQTKRYEQEIESLINFIRIRRREYISECGVRDSSNDGNQSVSFGHNRRTNSPILNAGIFGIAVIVIAGIIFSMYNWGTNEEGMENRKTEKLTEWEQNIRGLKTEFPSQNQNMWSDILSGVKTIVTEKPVKPSVFLLLYKDKGTSNCLASKVGKEAVKLLSESSQEPIVIRGENLKMNKSLIEDYGTFMETYKQDIERKHVMIVFDLQEIPAIVAQTFHTLCDVENPLVSDAAFLFTLQIVGNYEKQKPMTIAEKTLKILWKDSLNNDIMDPLITRVTNSVLLVELEDRLPC